MNNSPAQAYRQDDDTPRRYAVLDAWRGIAAVIVTIVHIPVAHALQGSTPFTNLQLFVDFFFVLSGFVICHAYASRLDGGASAVGFMIRRFGRVWPLHAAVLFGFVALELLKLVLDRGLQLPLDGAPFTGNHSPVTLVSNLALTQAFNLHGMTTWNGPAWSIGVEFYTYAVFALVVTALRARALDYAALAAIGLAGVAFLSPSWLFTTHDFGFFRCLYGFFTGALAMLAVARTRSAQRLGTWTEATALALVMMFLLTTGENASSLLAPLVFAGLIYVFAFEQGRFSAALHRPWAQALGLWSYSIYMVHMLLFAILKIALTFAAKVPGLGLTSPVVHPVKLWTFGHPVLDLLLMAFELALVVVTARFTYAAIEAPARRVFGGIAERYEHRIPAARVRLALGR